MKKTLILLFGMQRRVSRRAYLGWGAALAALKIGVDTAVVLAMAGTFWSPLAYILPSVTIRQHDVASGSGAMHALLALWALPFAWIGLTMSIRRAVDAGQSPWIGTLFLVPIVNYMMIAILGAMPSKGQMRWEPAPVMGPYRGGGEGAAPPPSSARTLPLPPALRAALLAPPIGIGMIALCSYAIGQYGFVLFLTTPFAMGAIASVIYNRPALRSYGSTVGVALAAVAIAGGLCLLFAIEGILCLAMAFPIAAAMTTAGALVARAIVAYQSHELPPLAVIALPLFAFGESHLVGPVPRDVVTTIEIDAPPEAVWPNVIGFSELPAPPEWFFRLGIAYPMRARIHGAGVGAVRHCEFSTGPFVEPITVWDPLNRLAFDVTSQPPSMTEWSPYRNIKAPHVENYMVSKGGEFRLVRLAGNRTRLEGTTHYTLAIYPEVYWVNYAEVLLHAIHHRVLVHIKASSEAQAQGHV
ncbi:DUF805 domain-containing protein [Pendulispora rubella]|uniref:DUF805 domain-containing protein n=1 Tax=Pendulispora rubella TaxID=2741070 RepID=A0ABZ2L9E7_9BACT